MKNNRIHSVILAALGVVSLMLAGSGCAKEDTTECRTSYIFTVRAYDADNNDLSGSLNDVVLYIFDKDSLLLDRIETSAGARVEYKAPWKESVYAVAWGNTASEMQSCNQLGRGDHYNSGYMTLQAVQDDDVSLEPHCLLHACPDDVFHGAKSAIKDDSRTDITIPVYRKTGQMNITIRGLQDDGDELFVVVRETFNAFDFHGRRTGTKAAYRADGTFEPTTRALPGDYFIDTFNLVPAPEGVSLDIYKGTSILTSVTQNQDGAAITVREGKMTNVLIDLSASLEVNVTMTPWNQKEIWKNF